MKICYFGTYSKDYSRNRVIIKGLKKNGVNVIECHYPLWKGVEPRIQEFKGISGLIKLFFKFLIAYLSLIIKFLEIIEKPDFIIVGYTGHFDVPLAFFFSKLRSIPLAFDFFVSLWDTFVKDRKLFRENSLISTTLKFIDRVSLILPDIIFLDTASHIDFVSKEYGIDRKKFRRFWVGEDDEIFYPRDVEKFSKFTVLFFGGFIPLHGMEFIIDAARMLKEEDIRFLIVGKGQLYDKIYELAKGLKNVEFTGWVELENIPEIICKSHISLGIFGKTDKANRVIPNKIYESIACKVPVITGLNDGILEIFKDRKNIILCNMGDGKGLRDAILRLKKNRRLMEKIAEEGYKLFKEKFTPEKIGYEVLNELKKFKEER